MLSILVPVYNYDVRKFISELHLQAVRENIEFEIIAADDFSENYFRKLNNEISAMENTKYILLEKNIGRSKIRNFLAEQAKYNSLLFVDCDMEVIDNEFIKKYIEFLNKCSVICGGIEYPKTKPENPKLFLRWYYGQYREKKTANTRNKNKYASFMSSNFLIQKEIFNDIKFNNKLTDYGHEDTLFGIELKRKNISINHINNPLIHKGLEPADIFIEKTKIGIKNLKYITENFNYPELYKEIKLLHIAKKLFLFRKLITEICFIFKPLIFKNLKSNKPKLFIFDFFKLSVYFKKQ